MERQTKNYFANIVGILMNSIKKPIRKGEWEDGMTEFIKWKVKVEFIG